MKRFLLHPVAAAMGVLLAALCLGGCEADAGRDSSAWNLDTPDWMKPARDRRAEYSILLGRFHGSDRRERAEALRYRCKRDAGWEETFVVHEAGRSSVYRGGFADRDAARKPLAETKRFRAPDGGTPFVMSILVPYPMREPVGDARYDLSRVEEGTYTVVIEVYYDETDSEEDYIDAGGRTEKRRVTDRYLAAAKRCEELRAEGVEAYFYHGPGNSLVTVGIFPESSIQSEIVEGKEKKRIVDPRLIAVLENHPHLYVNGMKRQYATAAEDRDGAPVKFVYRPCYPALIPQAERDRNFGEDFYGRPEQWR
jgi:hypothetical protein